MAQLADSCKSNFYAWLADQSCCVHDGILNRKTGLLAADAGKAIRYSFLIVRKAFPLRGNTQRKSQKHGPTSRSKNLRWRF